MKTTAETENARREAVLTPAMKRKLAALADRYETEGFPEGDPSRVLKRYTNIEDVETAAFIAAVLAFGRREQFLAKTDFILAEADRHGGPAAWVRGRKYRRTFGDGGEDEKSGKGGQGGLPSAGGVRGETRGRPKFYRFFSHGDMAALFRALGRILEQSPSLGEFFRRRFVSVLPPNLETPGVNPNPANGRPANGTVRAPLLAPIVCGAFAECAVVPQGKTTANKRINMFLRWMVRTNSPVDLGIWDWYRPSDLIIPLDTHVLQESRRLGLLPEKSAGTLKTAVLLTDVFRLVWPDDPCRGDFALFGLGVDQSRTR